jgi:hypothetical protein
MSQTILTLTVDAFDAILVVPPDPPITILRLRLPNPQNGGYGKTLPLGEIFVERGSQRRTFVYPHDGFYPTMIAQIEQAIAALRP